VSGNARENVTDWGIAPSLSVFVMPKTLEKTARARSKRSAGLSRVDGLAKQIDWRTMPQTPLEEVVALDFAGVYFVISAQQELLYIGRSVNIAKRLKGRHLLTQKLNPYEQYFVAAYKKNGSDKALETALIGENHDYRRAGVGNIRGRIRRSRWQGFD
jgi:hypothetical protein